MWRIAQFLTTAAICFLVFLCLLQSVVIAIIGAAACAVATCGSDTYTLHI